MLIINLPSDGLSKKDIFTAMVKAAEQDSSEAQLMADNEEAIVAALMNREKLGDTCVAPGIAMAHARIEALQRVFLMGAILSEPMEWGGQNQVELVFMLLIPGILDAEGAKESRKLMKLLADDEVCRNMIQAATPAELQSFFLN